MITYWLSFGPCASGTSFGTDLTLSGDTASVISPVFSPRTVPKTSVALTISPFGPLNPCGPFPPASPWRRQIKHTAIHRWDRSSVPPESCYDQSFSRTRATNKSETHCLSDDSGNARFTPETREALNTTTERHHDCSLKKEMGQEGRMRRQRSRTRSPTDPIGPCSPLRPRGP